MSRENKTKEVKTDNIFKELLDSVKFIFRGILYYYYLLIDFLFGNISNIVMYNLLKITIVFLTIVSFTETFKGLSSNFFDTWTAFLVTLGVQGTLMALSLYIPILHTNNSNNKEGNKTNITVIIKRYIIWVPLMCCLVVSSFFSYVSISKKMYDKIEDVNNEYKSKEIINNVFLNIDKELNLQTSITEENIDNVLEHINANIDGYLEDNKIDTTDISDIDSEITELEDELQNELVSYERALDNYQIYQNAMASTVDATKRKINEDKANLELAKIEDYENKKSRLDKLMRDKSNKKSNLDKNSILVLVNEVKDILEDIDKYNMYDIELPFSDVSKELDKISINLDKLGVLDIRLNYLLNLIQHKQELIKYKEESLVEKLNIIEKSDISQTKEVIIQAPFEVNIISPTNLNNKDITSINTFKLLEEVYNFERLTGEGISQIEKAIGYLNNNSFPMLAYISILMAFFIDALILIQGFSVTKKIKNSEDMDETEKQDFIFWMMRRSYLDRDKETGKVTRVKSIDKFLNYCTPNENCTKVYLDMDKVRVDPQISMLVSILNKLGYLILNEDERLILDQNLMVIYLQRTSLMVDTDYFYKNEG